MAEQELERVTKNYGTRPIRSLESMFRIFRGQIGAAADLIPMPAVFLSGRPQTPNMRVCATGCYGNDGGKISERTLLMIENK